MNKTTLALAVSLGLLAAPAPAAVFTDWVAFDPFADTAEGTLGTTSVEISGGDIDLVLTEPFFPGFASPNFTPPTPASEAVSLIIGGFPSGDPAHTVTFGSAVVNPVIHLAGLSSTLTFSTADITKLSGSFGLSVVGNQVSGGLAGPVDEGTIQLNGSITSFTFTGAPAFGLNFLFIQIGGTVGTPVCTIACPPPVTVGTDPGECTASGVALGDPTIGGDCTVASVVNNAPAAFPKGTTVVTWTLTDTAGNSSTCPQNVTVADIENPTIACPANVLANTDPGLCSASLLPGSPGADDNCPGVTVAGTRSDGQFLNSPYPKGVTVITWTATDAAGHTASCLQSITVEDHEPPQFTCPADVTGSSVPPPVTEALDNCDPPPTVTSVDVSTGDCSLVITRTYTVTDASGNVTSCQQIITVNNALFAADAILWHQPLARNGLSEDTDPSAGGSLKYRFKLGGTIPIKVHAQGCSGDVTANANVTGTVQVFGDTNCDGVADGSELPEFNGVGGAGGVMDKIDGHLKYNLDTKTLPSTTRCYILRVTVTDTSTGAEKSEIVLLQAR